jgi:HK97 family phage major capsid protein
MRRATLNKIAQLTDKNGRPLHLIHFESGVYYLLGWPIKICPSMPAIAASAKTVALGDLSRFIARYVGEFETRRYVERWADYGQIGLESFWRAQGTLADTNSIKVLQQHS